MLSKVVKLYKDHIAGERSHTGILAINLSANMLQQVINQLFSFIVFLVLSYTLDKAAFGQINWALAFFLTAFNILSCGIDQLVIRKTASGENAPAVLSLHMMHVLVSGGLFYALLLLCKWWVPIAPATYNLLLLLGIGKLAIFFSTPFKQVATGLEKFHIVAYMSVCSNVLRGITLILFSLLHWISLTQVVVIFAISDLAELLLCGVLSNRLLQVPLHLQWQATAYLRLLKEALPQMGVVILMSVLSRFDWLYIGLMVSDKKLAEYSFAYKIFELSTFPLLVIAPLLIPRFTKFVVNPAGYDTSLFASFLKTEMLLAALILLVSNCWWCPVMDAITNGKYGSVNSTTYWLLSLSTPFLYLNNFLWTIQFAKGHLTTIFSITVITCIVNVSANVLLIHFYGNEGAAMAFLLATIVQSLLYAGKSESFLAGNRFYPVWGCALIALLPGLATQLFAAYPFTVCITAIVICYLILSISGYLRKKEFRNALRLLKQ